jgi:hypothetical protein
VTPLENLDRSAAAVSIDGRKLVCEKAKRYRSGSGQNRREKRKMARAGGDSYAVISIKNRGTTWYLFGITVDQLGKLLSRHFSSPPNLHIKQK